MLWLTHPPVLRAEAWSSFAAPNCSLRSSTTMTSMGNLYSIFPWEAYGALTAPLARYGNVVQLVLAGKSNGLEKGIA